MAPKKNAQKAEAAPPSAPAGPTAAAAIPGTMTSQPKAVLNTKIAGGAQNWDRVLANIYNHYVNSTPQRTKLIDVFMVFLVVVGGLQFLYCVLAGNYVCWKPLLRSFGCG